MAQFTGLTNKLKNNFELPFFQKGTPYGFKIVSPTPWVLSRVALALGISEVDACFTLVAENKVPQSDGQENRNVHIFVEFLGKWKPM
jgi:hypothetical protein